jgi:hypothetical protein
VPTRRLPSLTDKSALREPSHRPKVRCFTSSPSYGEDTGGGKPDTWVALRALCRQRTLCNVLYRPSKQLFVGLARFAAPKRRISIAGLFAPFEILRPLLPVQRTQRTSALPRQDRQQGVPLLPVTL